MSSPLRIYTAVEMDALSVVKTATEMLLLKDVPLTLESYAAHFALEGFRCGLSENGRELVVQIEKTYVIIFPDAAEHYSADLAGPEDADLIAAFVAGRLESPVALATTDTYAEGDAGFDKGFGGNGSEAESGDGDYHHVRAETLRFGAADTSTPGDREADGEPIGSSGRNGGGIIEGGGESSQTSIPTHVLAGRNPDDVTDIRGVVVHPGSEASFDDVAAGGQRRDGDGGLATTGQGDDAASGSGATPGGCDGSEGTGAEPPRGHSGDVKAGQSGEPGLGGEPGDGTNRIGAAPAAEPAISVSPLSDERWNGGGRGAGERPALRGGGEALHRGPAAGGTTGTGVGGAHNALTDLADLLAAHQREILVLGQAQHAEITAARDALLAEIADLATRVAAQQAELADTEQRLGQARSELQLAVASQAALAAALDPLIRRGLLTPCPTISTTVE